METYCADRVFWKAVEITENSKEVGNSNLYKVTENKTNDQTMQFKKTTKIH